MHTALKCLISVCHIAIFIYGFQLQRNDPELSNLNVIGFSIYCSRGAALCLAFDMAIIMLPMCRKLLSYTSRIAFALTNSGQGTFPEGSHSSTVIYHKFLAYHILFFLTVHVLGHCINFYRLEQLGRGAAMGYHFGSWAGVTGYWMLLLLGAMFITAHKTARKRNFEVFWYTHHAAVFVMVFLAFHGYGCFVKTNSGQCRGYDSWRYTVLAIIIYLAERALRALESSKLIKLTSAIAHPGGAIELRFKQPSIQYRPGQHVYLNIPLLSKYEWHPFTITSSPIEELISLDIRQDGDWTCSLGRHLGYGPEMAGIDRAHVVQDRSLLPLIRVDGPYGGPKEDVLNFDHAILIGTGNGITTFSGILRHIWFRHQITQSSSLKTLNLYWVSRDANKLDWFRSLFSMEKTMELFRTGLIRIHIYFTSSKPSRPRGNNDRSLRVNVHARGDYSDDDEENEENEELISPKDYISDISGSGSLISLSSVLSTPPNRRTSLDTDGERVERSLDNIEQGDVIIGPNNIHLGRPDFGSIFGALKDKALSNSSSSSKIRIGVFYCGSPGLASILAQECKRKSDSHIQFVFFE